MDSRIKAVRGRITQIALVSLIVATQLLPVVFLQPQRADAFVPGATCVDDVVGANDEPTQKDLSQMCVIQSFDVVNGTTYGVYWSWDDVSWPGGNTGDACALLDDDGNTFADVAVCVTVGGTPATQDASSPHFYSCTDTSATKCFGATTITLPSGSLSTCSVVANDPIDPFSSGNASPLDTSARCVLIAQELGLGTTAILRDVCSYPSQVPNSDPSDCIAYTTKATVSVTKQLSPITDTGLFTLSVGSTTVTNVGNNGTTGEVVVDSGSVTISETPVSGTLLTNYNTYIECREDDGAGAVVASGTRTGSGSRQLTFTVKSGEDINCTISNTRKTGGLTVNKVLIQDNGGNETATDFSFTANSVNAVVTSYFEADGSNVLQVPIGTYTVTEDAYEGYETAYSNCTSLVVIEGQTQTCTITNNDIAPRVFIDKHVINDNGGTLTANDFMITADGDQVVFDDGVATSTNQMTYSAVLVRSTLDAMVLEEAVSSGYTASSWICDGQESATGQTVNIQPQLGEDIYCELTNDDNQAKLIVQKQLTQDNGGTKNVDDFSFSINNEIPSTFEADGINEILVDAGSYSVSETFAQGYATTYDNCENIVLEAGDEATCIISNDDLPAFVTVTKTFVNTFNGGLDLDDFIFSLVGAQSTTVVQSGIAVMINAGTYTATEQAQGDIAFIASEWSGDCSTSGTVVVELGGSYECMITNYDEPAFVVVHKEVINDHGGSKDVEDFSFQISGLAGSVPFDADGEVMVVLDGGNTNYTITENADSAYAVSYDGCSFSAVNGETYHCYITNNDIAPTLSVTKLTSPCEQDSIFPVTITQNGDVHLAASISGTPCYETASEATNTLYALDTLQAGLVGVSEAVPEGWVQEYMSCINSDTYAVFSATDQMLFENGQDYSCIIVNTALSDVSVTKFHDINQDGFWDKNEPTLEDWDMTLTPSFSCDMTVLDAPTAMLLSKDMAGDSVVSSEPLCETSTLIEPTDEDGTAYFNDVYPGYYDVDEVMKSNEWVQSSVVCIDTTMYEYEYEFELEYDEQIIMEEDIELEENGFYVRPGGSAECFIGNYKQPKVAIVKSNSTTGPVSPGTTITFTLQITVPDDETSGLLQGAMSGSTYLPVTVSDFLTDEFDYIPGSFTASSSVRGDLRSAGITTDPLYNSPGIWNLTSPSSNVMVHKEIVTLTYKAVVSSTTPAGTYPTEATVKGYGDSESIVVTATDPDSVTVIVPQVLSLTTTRPRLQQTGVHAFASIVGIMIIASVLLLQRRKSNSVVIVP